MTFQAFLAENAVKRCWILEIFPLSLAPVSDGTDAADGFSEAGFSEVAFAEGGSADTLVLRYASHGYTTKSTDSPASTYIDARIPAGGVKIERWIYAESGGIGGLTHTVADVSLINTDGELDSLPDDYALDGRPFRLYLGRDTDPFEDFGLVLVGVIEKVERGDAREIVFTLSDGIAKLDVPLSPNTYAGTGALEGGEDLKGKPKPKVWGVAKNITPPLVNSALLIYQVHDGWIWDVMSVRDRGVRLVKGADYASRADMEANAPAAGQYRVWHEGGFFRLNAAPAGTVTCDVAGDSTGPGGAGYVGETAEILKRVLLIAGVDASLIHTAAFTQLLADAPAEVGHYVGTEGATVREVAELFLAGIGAFGGFSRTGLFTAGVVKAPAGAEVATYTAIEIGKEGPQREPLPAAVEPVVWRARVAWGRNYTVQTDIAAGALAADRTFAAEPERIAKRDDDAVRSQRLLARVLGPTGNLYAEEADADAEALRQLNLWKVPRGVYRVNVPATALERDIGDEVKIQHNRHGFTAGKNAIVLAHNANGARVQLTVLA